LQFGSVSLRRRFPGRSSFSVRFTGMPMYRADVCPCHTPVLHWMFRTDCADLMFSTYAATVQCLFHSCSKDPNRQHHQQALAAAQNNTRRLDHWARRCRWVLGSSLASRALDTFPLSWSSGASSEGALGVTIRCHKNPTISPLNSCVQIVAQNFASNGESGFSPAGVAAC
jgi:hypothetical protein